MCVCVAGEVELKNNNKKTGMHVDTTARAKVSGSEIAAGRVSSIEGRGEKVRAEGRPAVVRMLSNDVHWYIGMRVAVEHGGVLHGSDGDYLYREMLCLVGLVDRGPRFLGL